MLDIWTDPHPIVRSPLNVRYAEVLQMDQASFETWALAVRISLADSLKSGIPPHDGVSLDQIEDDMRSFAVRRTDDLLITDQGTNKKDVIKPAGRHAAFLRSVFPGMCKSGDGNADGASISDYLLDDEYVDKWVGRLSRAVWHDSMYQYSPSLKRQAPEALGASSGYDWLELPRRADLPGPVAPFWCERVENPAPGVLTVSASNLHNLVRLGRVSPDSLRCAGIDRNATVDAVRDGIGHGRPEFPWLADHHYAIRIYRESERIFPKLFSLLRLAVVVQGTNFPAIVAKYIYQRFTQHLVDAGRPINIWDPSAGYGGRLYGALAASADRRIRYIGTDPNTDNWLTPETSRYEALADHYQLAVPQRHHAEVLTLCAGSETAHENPHFQRMRGELDLVFTSPPYFCAELYSREPTQSAIKFPTYEQWRDGFLRRTLKTCAEWVRPGGYVIWNIADIKHKGRYLPLEQDSCNALKEFGMEYVEKLKMLVATVTGGGKLKDGLPTTKNYVRVNGCWRKYEPLFVFKKPV